MAWKTEITTLVRNLIGDTDLTSVTYTDERLQESILSSAQLIQGEMTFGNTYTVDIDQCILTPDPTLNTKDNTFINLLALRTACTLLRSEAKTAALQAVNFVDGPSKIDGRGASDGIAELAKSACQMYEDAKHDYKVGGNSVGAIIVTPYNVYNYRGYGRR
jgi:hypothetical protein